ncbi:hypothetical protein FRC04_003134 [Tulasnella sp. 424]|nr:hypothetical protein FRC04_003134 [Tulasnella sp. 424]KAG8961748.1 hypothetical protein FRC05_005815 [Tulasnella sp. 425]
MFSFEDPRRQMIRRTEIIKTVLPKHSRGYNVVFCTYIVRSTLNPNLIKLANKKNDKLYEEEVRNLRALGLIGKA